MRLAVQSSYGTACRSRPRGAYRWRTRALATEAAADVPALVSWVERNGGRVQGATLANLAGRDGGSGWGLKALQVRARPIGARTDKHAGPPAPITRRPPPARPQSCTPGARLIELPPHCQLTYDAGSSDPRLLALVEHVPAELWGAKLALQVRARAARLLPGSSQLPARPRTPASRRCGAATLGGAAAQAPRLLLAPVAAGAAAPPGGQFQPLRCLHQPAASRLPRHPHVLRQVGSLHSCLPQPACSPLACRRLARAARCCWRRSGPRQPPGAGSSAAAAPTCCCRCQPAGPPAAAAAAAAAGPTCCRRRHMLPAGRPSRSCSTRPCLSRSRKGAAGCMSSAPRCVATWAPAAVQGRPDGCCS
jgi:hypothetical protein